MNAQIVTGGVVTNVIAVDPSAVLTNPTTITGPGGVITAPAGSTFMMQAGAGIGWTLSGSTLVAPTPAPVTLTAAQLIAYASQKQSTIMGGGISVSIASGVSVECSTDATSLVLLQGAATIAESSPSTTFNWVPKTGSPAVLTAAQITTMFTAVSAFLQATFTTLAGVIAAINAGTISTTAQVDAFASPAWPVNS